MKNNVRTLMITAGVCGVLILTSGCEAFVRKFTRKPKRRPMDEASLVLEPESYEATRISNQDLAVQYYTFWRGWQGELVQALKESTNHRKQVDRANEALDNLINFGALLTDDAKARLAPHIEALTTLRDDIDADVHGMHAASHADAAEALLRAVVKTFPSKTVADEVAGVKEP